MGACVAERMGAGEGWRRKRDSLHPVHYFGMTTAKKACGASGC